MQFRFLHIHGESGKCYVTGCFERCKDGTVERNLLDSMAECIGELNTSYKSDKIVLKDNTIFFRAIDADWLVSTLKYWDRCLELSLTYKVGRNVTYTGDRAKEMFEKAVSDHSISVKTP